MLRLALLDGSILEVTAPAEALGSGTTSHTVVNHNGTVVTVETGDGSFGTGWLAELADPQVEAYHGGELINGELNGSQAIIWRGTRYSLLLAYDAISPEDARAVLDALNFFEEADGIVAKGQVPMQQTTVTVPLRGGGGLEIEPAVGPTEKEMIVERGSSGEVTSIEVAYPTANATVYIPPTRSGASFLDLVALVDVHWDR